MNSSLGVYIGPTLWISESGDEGVDGEGAKVRYLSGDEKEAQVCRDVSGIK